MTARAIKLIALDLDGTLIGDDLVVSPRNARAIRAAEAMGVRVTLSTGRMFRATLPFVRQLELTAPVMCYQGAWIGDPVSGERLFHQPVPLPLARQVVALGKERNYTVQVYLDDHFYVDHVTPEAQIYQHISGVEPEPVGNLLEFMRSDPTKIVIVTNEEITARLVPELASRFGSRLYITRSYPIFTEAVHPDVSKGRGLLRLAQLLNVDISQVMAIGDNLNDRDLVRAAGFGVAMANAAPEVKAVAHYVTGGVDEDGVAQAIEEFVLNGRT